MAKRQKNQKSPVLRGVSRPPDMIETYLLMADNVIATTSRPRKLLPLERGICAGIIREVAANPEITIHQCIEALATVKDWLEQVDIGDIHLDPDREEGNGVTVEMASYFSRFCRLEDLQHVYRKAHECLITPVEAQCLLDGLSSQGWREFCPPDLLILLGQIADEVPDYALSTLREKQSVRSSFPEVTRPPHNVKAGEGELPA
jgi:hypothetical protein